MRQSVIMWDKSFALLVAVSLKSFIPEKKSTKPRSKLQKDKKITKEKKIMKTYSSITKKLLFLFFFECKIFKRGHQFFVLRSVLGSPFG